MKTKRGFTIFELLAVLMIIGVSLVVVLGSYTSWATIHALDGAARTLEAGVLQARTLAKAKNTYVMFSYVTSDPATNVLRQVSSYDIRICNRGTNDIANPLTPGYDFENAMAPFTSQRLNRHVTLVGGTDVSAMASWGGMFFTPDGNLAVMLEEGEPPAPHYIAVSTRKHFSISRSATYAEPLYRFIRVDYATGLPTVLRPGQLDLTGGNF